MDYRQAGVDIDAAEAATSRIKRLAQGTFNPSVLTAIGSFGAMFRPDFSRFQDPVLVASTDGVGTKVRVAVLADRHDTLGEDIVHHCINDILVQGAVPLFFLDYLAFGKLEPAKVEALVSGMARACAAHDCPLIGGETAEMPGTYAPDDYDVAGFIVGIVDRSRALTGARVREGDILVGLPSSGLHTNGYSLARRALLEAGGFSVHDRVDTLGEGTLADALLAPHRCYLPALEPLLERDKVRAMVHITGGGFEGNIPRVLPEGLGVTVRTSAWPVPPLFRLIQDKGGVETAEMYRVFNMGVGMILIVAPEDLHEVEHSLERRGEVSWVIGAVERGPGVRLG